MSDESRYTSSPVDSSTSTALLSRIQELRNWQAQQRLQLEQSRSPSISSPSFSKPLPGYNNWRPSKDLPLGLEHISNSDADLKSSDSSRLDKPFQSYNEAYFSKESEVLKFLNPSLEQQNNVVEDAVFAAEEETSELFLGDNLEDVGVINHQPVPKKKFLRKGEGLRRFMGAKAPRKCSSQGQGVQSENLSSEGQGTQKENLPPQDQESKFKVKRPFLKKGEGLRRWEAQGSINTKKNGNKSGRELLPLTSKKELFKQPIPKLRLQATSDQIRPVAAHEEGLDIASMGVDNDLQGKDSVNVQGVKPHHVKCSKRELKGSEFALECPAPVEIEKALRKEEKELNAFEKLEELAADSSFSSNSSTVIQLLHQGLHSQTSTPMKTSVSESTPLSSKRSNLSDTSASAAVAQKVASNNLLERFIETNSNYLAELQDYIHENPGLNHHDGHLNVGEMLVKLSELMQHSEVVSNLDQNLEQPSAHAGDSMSIQNLQGFVTPLHMKPTPRVHFRPQGADVLEFEGDDTLTDASSLAEDDSELVTTSELEALSSLDWNFRERLKSCALGLQFSELQKIDEEEVSEFHKQEEDTLMKEPESSRNYASPRVLEYSPPPKSLPKHTDRPVYRNKKIPNEQKVRNQNEVADEKTKCESVICKKDSTPQPTLAESDVQTAKALLMTKVVELEFEIENFKNESAKISELQDKIQKEKKVFDDEKFSFKQEMKIEKEKLRKFIEHEKQKLWKERQALISRSQSQSKVDEDCLNIAYLKEKYEDLQSEIKKKEANHLASEKKLKDRLNFYEFENKSLKEKLVKMEALEKENKNLKVQIEKLQASKKTTHIKSAQKPKVAQQNKSKLANKNKRTFKKINENVNQQDFPKRDGNDISIQDVYPVRSIDPNSLSKGQNPTRCVRFEDQVNFASAQPVPLSFAPDIPLSNNSDNSTPTLPENVEDRCIEDCVTDQVEEATLAVPTVPSSAVGEDVSLDAPSIDCTQNYNADGTLEIIYANGNKKEVHKNGTCIIHYYNGDVKEMHQDKVVYVYGSDQTRHTTYEDGMEIVEFANGQREVRHPDGSSEIIFTDKTRKMVCPDGSEELTTNDGTVIYTKPDGSKVFQFTNGQREVHENGEKRREYPDGTVKIVRSDGLVETHYRNGRKRVRDKDGNLLVDSIT